MIRQGKFGKLFERLKTAEILDCLRRYEGEVRTEVMETLHKKRKSESFDTIERTKDYKPLGEFLKNVLNEPTPIRDFDRLGARLKKKTETNNEEK
jgi:hypothetical protein